MNKYAIVLAAGKGTRMKSDLPKVLHKVLDKPMVSWVISSLKDAGANRIITVVGYGGELVEKEVGTQSEFAYQYEQNGTGDAVKKAEQLRNEEGITLVAYGDSPCFSGETYRRMYDQLKDADMAVLTADLEDPRTYGRIIQDKDGNIEKIVEYKDCTDEEKKITNINTGLYVFNNRALFNGLDLLKNNNAAHEYYLTDLVEILRNQGKRVIAIPCLDWEEAMGVNDNVQLEQASSYLQDRINKHWMNKGVTIISSKNTWIGPDVKIGHDVLIYPNVQLYGHCVIHDHVVLMPGFVGKDVEIQEGESVQPYTYRV